MTYIWLHVMTLQESRARRNDVGHLRDETLVTREEKVPHCNVGGVGLVVSPSVVYLIDSYGIL